MVTFKSVQYGPVGFGSVHDVPSGTQRFQTAQYSRQSGQLHVVDHVQSTTDHESCCTVLQTGFGIDMYG